MCIVIVTTAHPKYPLIVLNNRDEYLHRPTDVARWWPDPDSHILGGRDLHRKEHGTWLGITRQGRLAVLTNYREDGAVHEGRRSRGAMVNAYLRIPPESKDSSKAIAEQLIQEGLSGVGGFSLMFGHLKKPWWQNASSQSHEKPQSWPGLAIVSNRSAHIDDVAWLCGGPGETRALSNSVFGDMSWPKVTEAEKLVTIAIKESSEKDDSGDQLISRLIDVLSLDTLPQKKPFEAWDAYMYQLRNSILIPSIGSNKQGTDVRGQSPMPDSGQLKAKIDQATHGIYGTQKQTIILVDWSGNVHYFERTLFDEEGHPIEIGAGDLQYTFEIEEWDQESL